MLCVATEIGDLLKPVFASGVAASDARMGSIAREEEK
jgi:hypothetical protein